MKKSSEWENRLVELEAEIARLSEAAAALRQEHEQVQSGARRTQSEYDAMKEAIVRYAVACGAVDVQMAVLRARPAADGREEALDNLRRAMDEQNEASEALRALARTLQRGSGGSAFDTLL